MTCFIIIYLVIGFLFGIYFAATNYESILEAFLIFLIGIIGWPGVILWILTDE